MENAKPTISDKDLTQVQMALAHLKEKGLINYNVIKLNNNPAEDIINIEILAKGYSLAKIIQEFQDSKITIH